MQNLNISLTGPTRLVYEDIYQVFIKNYQNLISQFLEFQFSWLQQAYLTMNDLDKYNILVYLYKKNFVSLSEIFKFKSFNEFYFNPRFNLEKINVIEISKELRISKETSRRKILELQKDGILIKDKKTITVTLKAGLLQKPNNTISSFSKILSNISYFLYKEKKVKKFYDKEFFEKKIKDRFTQVLGIFLDYQLDYLITRKIITENDMELFFIFGTMIYNQNIYLKKNNITAEYRDEWWEFLTRVGDKKGLNAMTISDLTGIPRPTVIRKLKIMLKNKDVYKDKSNLYLFIKGKMFRDMNKLRLKNIERLSSTISKINNIIFFS
tara:strand:- start:392 stop:1363 length:972 start_codon:yes stop_codon:yes gene_type:complete